MKVRMRIMRGINICLCMAMQFSLQRHDADGKVKQVSDWFRLQRIAVAFRQLLLQSQFRSSGSSGDAHRESTNTDGISPTMLVDFAS